MEDAVYKCDDILRVLKLKRKLVFAAGQQSRKSPDAKMATSVCHPFFFHCPTVRSEADAFL